MNNVTLRDYFAGLAMQALLQRGFDQLYDGRMQHYDEEDGGQVRQLSNDAYFIADAMIAKGAQQ